MNNDLISREALNIDELCRLRSDLKTGLVVGSTLRTQTQIERFIKSLDDVIDNAPAVDIKDQIAGAYNEGYMCGNKEAEKARQQGEWKVYGRQGGIPITDYCSNCKYEMMWYRNKYNYCPNCGAKMKGKKKEVSDG